MRFRLGILALLLLSAPALAQTSVRQSGTVTPGHAAIWTAPGIIQDGGTAANGFLTSLGVIAAGPGICQQSGAITGAYNQICLGVTATGGGTISINNYNGGTGGLSISVNGTAVALTTSTLPTVAGVPACYTNVFGALADCTTITLPSYILSGSGSGLTTLTSANSSATNYAITFPAAAGSVALVPGSTTQVAFNNAGALGADSGFTYAGAGQASLALGTITTNEKALNITATWNNAGTTFDAPLFENITNTASNSASTIFDFQVGGTSVVSSTAFGQFNIRDPTNNQSASWNLQGTSSLSEGFWTNSGPEIGSTGIYKISSTTSATGSPDTGLSRDAANAIDAGNGTQGDKSGQLNLATAKLTGVAFASLPTPAVGMVAHITDGKASNCADTTCTTFGTAVTAGTGALQLMVWYNGTNWTLTGK